MLSVPTLWTVFVINFLALGLIWAYVVRSYPAFAPARFWTGSSFVAAAGASVAMVSCLHDGFDPAADYCRYRSGIGDLRGGDGDPDVLRPACVVAQHCC